MPEPTPRDVLRDMLGVYTDGVLHGFGESWQEAMEAAAQDARDVLDRDLGRYMARHVRRWAAVRVHTPEGEHYVGVYDVTDGADHLPADVLIRVYKSLGEGQKYPSPANAITAARLILAAWKTRRSRRKAHAAHRRRSSRRPATRRRAPARPRPGPPGCGRQLQLRPGRHAL